MLTPKVLDIENRLEDAQEELEGEAALKAEVDLEEGNDPSMDASFMSESIYEKATINIEYTYEAQET